MTRGGRNLIILGVVSVLIALLTTGVSLAIYHNSGDIYLDRSRPGYLPDEEEAATEEVDGEYVFEKSGKLTEPVIDGYLEKLEMEIEGIDGYKNPFGAEILSDGNLGI